MTDEAPAERDAEALPPPSSSRQDYMAALASFDAAICEACAVSQATANRYTDPNVGYATRIFARMCGQGIALVRAAPLTRWTRSDFEDWNFAAIAGYARAILEGQLLFANLMAPPSSPEELRARINVMHLNDCTRRVELHRDLGVSQKEIDGLVEQQEELRKRLTTNQYFNALPAATQKSCLNGKFLVLENRDEMLRQVGHEKGAFDAFYDLLSQHSHILPLSFYRMEPNGRGTGVENKTDRSYMTMTLSMSAGALRASTDELVKAFPDAAPRRRGIRSRFSPGPRENLPAPEPNAGITKPDMASSSIKEAIDDAFG